MKLSPLTSLVDRLAAVSPNRRALERVVTQIALGVIDGFEKKRISAREAWSELFNLPNYAAIRRRRLNQSLRELFERAMELIDVIELAPKSLPQALTEIRIAADQVLRSTTPRRSAPRQKSVLRKAG